ncbi:MAG: cation-transporting P-type ATPase [Cypionkella sp.]
MKANAADLPYWCQDQDALIAALQSGPGGLGSARATRILAEVGPNSVERAVRLSVLRLILRQFESPLVLILVFAAAISLVLQQWVDAGIILAIVVGSSLLSFFQEYRASKAVDELKERLALTARVLRDGVEQLVPVALIVPGDVILLSAGNLIPADGRVIEAQDFLVSQASMTGESFPVEKRPGQVRANAPITERTNTVFMGASVRSGSARVLAVKTGRDTEFGAIAARLGAREPETDFARGVRQFGYLLIRVMVVIVIFVLTVNLLLHRPVIEFHAVCRGIGGWPFARTFARHHQRDPFCWGPRDEQARRHRAASGCDRKPWQHDHSLHRQDRHPDRGQDRSARGSGWRECGFGCFAQTGLSECGV